MRPGAVVRPVTAPPRENGSAQQPHRRTRHAPPEARHTFRRGHTRTVVSELTPPVPRSWHGAHERSTRPTAVLHAADTKALGCAPPAWSLRLPAAAQLPRRSTCCALARQPATSSRAHRYRRHPRRTGGDIPASGLTGPSTPPTGRFAPPRTPTPRASPPPVRSPDWHAHAVTDLDQWRQGIRDTLTRGGVTVIDSPTATGPEDAGVVVIPLDESAPAATAALVAALHMKVAVLLGSNTDDDTFDVHLVGTPWVQLLYATTDALNRVDEEPDDDTDTELAAADHDALTAVVDHLVNSTPLSSHGGQRDALDLFLTHVKENHPDLYARLPRQWFLMEYARLLHTGLKDRHVAILRSDTRRLAREVVDTGGLTAQMPKALIRDRVYAHLREQDPTCVTKSALEGVFYGVAERLAAGR